MQQVLRLFFFEMKAADWCGHYLEPSVARRSDCATLCDWLSALACHLGRFHSSPGPVRRVRQHLAQSLVRRPKGDPQQGRHLFCFCFFDGQLFGGLSRHLVNALTQQLIDRWLITVNTRSAASDYK